jgi:hypothetical protein
VSQAGTAADFDFKYDGGGLGKGGPGTLAVDGAKAAESRIERTSPVGKFTLDESFDVGQDTGTPVIDDYDAKMPFKFTGVLNKVVIRLGPDTLTPEQHGELEKLRREFALAMQGKARSPGSWSVRDAVLEQSTYVLGKPSA